MDNIKNAPDGQEQVKRITAKDLTIFVVETMFTAFVTNHDIGEAKK